MGKWWGTVSSLASTALVFLTAPCPYFPSCSIFLKILFGFVYLVDDVRIFFSLFLFLWILCHLGDSGAVPNRSVVTDWPSFFPISIVCRLSFHSFPTYLSLSPAHPVIFQWCTLYIPAYMQRVVWEQLRNKRHGKGQKQSGMLTCDLGAPACCFKLWSTILTRS